MKKLTVLVILAAGVILSFACAALAASTYGTAIDPTYIGVGARPLGMGKAYVALAEDATSIFVNPAGLGRINEMLFSSMYSNLMGEVNYTVGSITYPVGPGAIALGYLGAATTAIELYTDDPMGNPVAQGTADFSNNVIYASYGQRLTSLNPDIMVGVNIKSFNSGFSGSDLLTENSGTGFNLDLGILYDPATWFSAGLTGQNFLPAGKMQYKSGIEENMPSLTKIGLKVTLLGKYGFFTSPYKLNLVSDADLGSGSRKLSTLHLGAEFWPVPLLAIRAGLDQDPIAEGVQTNLTAGVGLRLGHVQFDYAYHTYYDIPENTTHFFSISYVGAFDEQKQRKVLSLNVDEPKDQMVIYDSKVMVAGAINDPRDGDRVLVDGKEAKIDEEGRFSANVEVKGNGAKKIEVKAIDEKGKYVEEQRYVFKLMSFRDVTGNYWAKSPIELLATAGLVTGYPDGTFMPDRTLTRAELATLLVRAKNIPLTDKAASTFSDVSSGHWAMGYIEAAVVAGLVKGYPDKTFRPDAKITRAEGVTVMARLEGLEEAALELAGDAEDSRFSDIVDSWAAGYIMAADQAGLLKYMKNTQVFTPSLGFTRAEAVEMISKTSLGKTRVKTMLADSGLDKTFGDLGMAVK